jgi:hypothetical protein
MALYKKNHKTHLRFYSAYDSQCDKTEFLVVEGAKWSELFPIKLTVRKLPFEYSFTRRQTPTIPRNYVSKLHDDLDIFRSFNMSEQTQ